MVHASIKILTKIEKKSQKITVIKEKILEENNIATKLKMRWTFDIFLKTSTSFFIIKKDNSYDNLININTFCITFSYILLYFLKTIIISKDIIIFVLFK